MNPRVRRLMADADAIRTEFAGHPHILVVPIGPDPAEAYRVTFNVCGVTLDGSGQPFIHDMHIAVIQLPATYPRQKPHAISETFVFHPNFAGEVNGEICIGDFWTPTRSLTDIVVAIGEMLQYQRYNTKSPLNAVAARWAAENEAIFPLGTIGLFQSEPEILLSGPSDQSRGIEVSTGTDVVQDLAVSWDEGSDFESAEGSIADLTEATEDFE